MITFSSTKWCTRNLIKNPFSTFFICTEFAHDFKGRGKQNKTVLRDEMVMKAKAEDSECLSVHLFLSFTVLGYISFHVI